MTWFEANTSASSCSMSAVSLRTQFSKLSSGSPVARRTRIEVSIPKRGVMGFAAEGFDVECALAPAQLAAQRGEARPVDGARAQDKTVGALFQLEPVTRLYAERIEDASGKRDLTFGGDFDEHGCDLQLPY